VAAGTIKGRCEQWEGASRRPAVPVPRIHSLGKAHAPQQTVHLPHVAIPRGVVESVSGLSPPLPLPASPRPPLPLMPSCVAAETVSSRSSGGGEGRGEWQQHKVAHQELPPGPRSQRNGEQLRKQRRRGGGEWQQHKGGVW